jgi:hypothetical protein
MLAKSTIAILFLLLVILILMPMSLLFVVIIMGIAIVATLDAKNEGFASKILSLFSNGDKENVKKS